MEVRSGYKQTEVGVIPEGWRVAAIKSFASIKTGKRNTQDRVADGAYPFFVRSQTVEQIDGYSFDGEAVLTAGDGVGTGKVFHYIQGRFDFHQRVYRISDFSPELDGFFFFLYFSNHFYDRIMSMTAKSSVDSVRLDMIADMAIPLPPHAEQRAIAGALRDADALLGALTRLIAKKRDLKQAAMQQLLTGQTRLPGFSGEWEAKSLKEVVQIPVTDGPHLTPEFLANGIPFLSVNNLVDNKINLSELRFISRSDHELFSRKCKPARNDLLLGKAASVGKVAFVDLDVEFNIWSPIALIRVNSQHSPKFFYYCFQSSSVISQISLLTNSSSQGNLGMGDIEKLEFPIPLLPEQTAIATVLSDMDAELAALEARLAKTRALKQGMMQELLTGRIRLF